MNSENVPETTNPIEISQNKSQNERISSFVNRGFQKTSQNECNNSFLQFTVEYRSHPASDAPTSLRGRVLGWRIPLSKKSHLFVMRYITLKSMPIDHGRTQNWDHNHVIICGHCGYVALHQREKDTRNIGPYVIMVIISLMDHMVIELM